MRPFFSSFWVGGVWLLLAGLQLASSGSLQRAPAGASTEERVRAEMLEALEDLVERERFFRRRSGAFTAVLGKLEFEPGPSLRQEVEIRVTSADREHLLVEAYREATGDRVWMDEQFRVQANFPILGLRWVVVEKKVPAVETDSVLPDLEIEPLNATASSELTAE
jgi:hypothetical protein